MSFYLLFVLGQSNKVCMYVCSGITKELQFASASRTSDNKLCYQLDLIGLTSYKCHYIHQQLRSDHVQKKEVFLFALPGMLV